MFFYKNEPVTESTNILFQVIGCIYAGIRYKLKNLRNHAWIDGTWQHYAPSFIEDVCSVLKARP